MLSTYTGDGERLRPKEAYGGHPVSYEAHLVPAERLAALLGDVGLSVTTRVLEEPNERVKRPWATLFARKPR